MLLYATVLIYDLKVLNTALSKNFSDPQIIVLQIISKLLFSAQKKNLSTKTSEKPPSTPTTIVKFQLPP